MRQRELEVLGHELLDVRAANILSLLHLDNFENLQTQSVSRSRCLPPAVRGIAYVDRPEPSSVTRSHVLVHGLHGVTA
jgi:hypothetical protein